MIAVSVIIPVYNAGRYLQQCLDSLRNQTLENIEIICVNDGSTDDSLSIIQSAVQADNRISVISQENKTAGAARNRGLEKASGKYLSFLDADDIFEKDMLKKAFLKAEANNAEIVVFRSNQYDEKKDIFTATNWTVKEKYIPNKDVFSHQDIEGIFDCFVCWAWDKLFATEFIKENNLSFQRQECINDLYFVYSALAKAKRICFHDEILVHKRINNAGSITTNYQSTAKWKCFYQALYALKEQLFTWGLYEELRQDYVNFALYFTLWNLDKYIGIENYESFYEIVKQEYIEKLDIINHPKNFFRKEEEYIQLCEIQQLSYKDYIWKRRLKRKNGEYLFPFELVEKGSDIVLYGAGLVGIMFARQVAYSKYCNIVAWIDKNYMSKGMGVTAPENINKIEFDYVIIAINDSAVAQKIREELEEVGIAKESILWKKPEIYLR